MSFEQYFEALQKAIVENDENRAVQVTKEALAQEISPVQIIEKGLSPGMVFIGDKFNRGECFLPELIQAADIFNAAMQVIEPVLLQSGEQQHQAGSVVLGTVKGDIHNIGKDIFGMLLKTRQFQIHDLGVDVPPSAFMNKAEEVKADIIAMSSLLTTTMPGQKDLIDILQEKGLREKYLIMVGGGPVNQNWANEIGADGYADTAEQALRLAEQLISEKYIASMSKAKA